MAEDRERFDELLEKYHIKRPRGVTVMTTDEALDVADKIGCLLYTSDMATDGTKITKIDILLKQSKLEALKEEMDKLGITPY